MEKEAEAKSSGATNKWDVIGLAIKETAKTIRKPFESKLVWAVLGLLTVSFVVSDDLSVASILSLVEAVGRIVIAGFQSAAGAVGL